MTLSDAQMEIVLGKRSDKWRHVPCERCGSEDWRIQPILYVLSEYHKHGALLGGSVLPLIAAHCAICGNVRLTNAIFLGVIDQKTGEWVND